MFPSFKLEVSDVVYCSFAKKTNDPLFAPKRHLLVELELHHQWEQWGNGYNGCNGSNGSKPRTKCIGLIQ